ncbi:MAG: DUF134 domain-containing protein [Clostridia bacterium]|nr:DUF134 domain-containing protein [Clostridia bacterium]
MPLFKQIGSLQLYRSFSPDDVEAEVSVNMTADEYEALRLLDHEGLNQKECAARIVVVCLCSFSSGLHGLSTGQIQAKQFTVGSCRYSNTSSHRIPRTGEG